MCITKIQYFIGRPHSDEQEQNATELLSRVNALLYEYQAQTGKEVSIHSHTNSLISPAGSQGFDEISGKTEGGFRLPDCSQGAALSSHKEAKAVDVYDPHEELDKWVTDEILAEFDLYREHPDSTVGWCHLSDRKPPSGNRTFYP